MRSRTAKFPSFTSIGTHTTGKEPLTRSIGMTYNRINLLCVAMRMCYRRDYGKFFCQKVFVRFAEYDEAEDAC